VRDSLYRATLGEAGMRDSPYLRQGRIPKITASELDDLGVVDINGVMPIGQTDWSELSAGSNMRTGGEHWTKNSGARRLRQ
jgi:hypothetical protein